MDILRDVLRHPLKPALRPPVVRAGGGKQRWRPELMALPPGISLDANRADLLTVNGSNVILTARTVHTDQPANTPNLVTYMASNAGLNGRPSINSPGQAAQAMNFSTAMGSYLSNKAGCTMVFCGRFGNANPGAFNSSIVNATTGSASTTRCSIATSGSVSNCPRHTIRKADGDAALGHDYGAANIGQVPWIAILRLDHAGAVIGAGTPTKEFQICMSGLATGIASFPTGLGTGTFGSGAAAYIGFFNSGTTAQAWVDMYYGAIFDRCITNAETALLQGWLAHGLGLPGMLHSSHAYAVDAPMV